MKQHWTDEIVKLLPATLKEINANPRIASMNTYHRIARHVKGSWSEPVNSMAYDTLYRLRKRGLVTREDNGVYRLVMNDEYMYTRGEYEC
jgi:hypothetical protein